MIRWFAELMQRRARRQHREAELLMKVGDQRDRIVAMLDEQAADKRFIESLQSQIRSLQDDADAGQEIDDAWAACPYPGNRKNLSLAEQMSALDTELEQLRDKVSASEAHAREADRLAGLAFKQMETYQDAVKMLVERKAISPIEVAQLNLGTFIPAVGGLPPTVEFARVAEGKTAVDFGMKAQATEAKFRQVKQHFQTYQGAIKVLLDQLNTLGRANVVTKEDLRKLRKLRDDLSAQIQRTI